MSLNIIVLIATIGLIICGVYTYSSIGGEDPIGYILFPLANILAAVIGGLFVVLLSD